MITKPADKIDYKKVIAVGLNPRTKTADITVKSSDTDCHPNKISSFQIGYDEGRRFVEASELRPDGSPMEMPYYSCYKAHDKDFTIKMLILGRDPKNYCKPSEIFKATGDHADKLLKVIDARLGNRIGKTFGIEEFKLYIEAVIEEVSPFIISSNAYDLRHIDSRRVGQFERDMREIFDKAELQVDITAGVTSVSDVIYLYFQQVKSMINDIILGSKGRYMRI
jgi:hypothetical protein